MTKNIVVVKSGGDIATGIIQRIAKAGFKVIITEIPCPMAIRRTVSFAEAVYKGQTVIEGLPAFLVKNSSEAMEVLRKGGIPILVDPEAAIVREIHPVAVVDAIIAKRNTGTHLKDAPMVIGVGPGFIAGQDCHAVVETQRGHDLGKVILRGGAAPNTGVPGVIGGYAKERVIYAPCAGIFRGMRQIGEQVQVDEIIAYVGVSEVRAQISGVLRGQLRDGLQVAAKTKIGDIDPRAKREHCFTISDKARAVGGGVLEALLHLGQAQGFGWVG